MNVARDRFDTNYEWKAVALLTLGFGLVGLDRNIIAPLFPSMMTELNLTYQDLGNIAGILGVAWGIFAVIAGNLSDRFGRRAVIVPAVIGFSLLSGFSGAATGLTSLLLIRALMGVTEGAYTPSSFAAVAEASKPSRLGFNQGLQQSAFPLIGLGLGPIIATQLLVVVPSWRWVFVVVAVPGFIIAALLWRTLREPAAIANRRQGAPRPALGELFKHRNVAIGMVALFCNMAGVFVINAMLPSYLIDFVKLSTIEMGVVASAIGFGGFLGQMVLPGCSDILGRKPMLILSFLGAAICVYAFSLAGAAPDAASATLTLFILLFFTCFFCFGILGLITGPIAVEAAPAGSISTVAGIIIGAGEIFGGGIAPAIAGGIAQRYGIEHVLTVTLLGFAAGIVASLFIQETAPRRVGALVGAD
jgi:MFS family permease